MRCMYRYVVSTDEQPHAITLTSDPVAVAAIGDWSVEFWAEHDPECGQAGRAFQVFGTGEPLPAGARWLGTCPRTEAGNVWHLYEVTP